jgi:hypothetical protein
MPKSVYITAPRPTSEEVEKSLGISKARKKALQPLVDKLKAKLFAQGSESVTALKPEKRRKSASAA